jgi:hypothetical protein
VKAGLKKTDSKKKNGAGFILDLSSREAFEQFCKAADAFDAKYGRSRAAARRIMVAEGLITKSGRLTKHYR